jgi:hypothetical protein
MSLRRTCLTEDAGVRLQHHGLFLLLHAPLGIVHPSLSHVGRLEHRLQCAGVHAPHGVLEKRNPMRYREERHTGSLSLIQYILSPCSHLFSEKQVRGREESRTCFRFVSTVPSRSREKGLTCRGKVFMVSPATSFDS